MSKKYSADELQVISLYKEKNKSSTTLMVEHAMTGDNDGNHIKKLIKPCELINLTFNLDGDIAKGLFKSNIITINQTIAENLINNIEENILIKLVDHRWVGDSTNNNLLIAMLKLKKINLIEKTIGDYLTMEIQNYNNSTYKNFNVPLINNFFSGINYTIKNIENNIFLDTSTHIDLNFILDIAIKSGETVLKIQNKDEQQPTLNEKLHAVSTNIYNFLDIAIHFDDANLFKKLFNEIPIRYKDIYFKYNKDTANYYEAIFVEKNQIHTNLIENMITCGSYKILNFLKNNNFKFSLKKTFITSNDNFTGYDFTKNNIKDLLVFKLIDNISSYASKSINAYPEEKRKLEHINLNNKILNCLTIFEDTPLNDGFLQSNHISYISAKLFLCGEKKLLEDLIKLFPEINEQKKLFYGENLTLKESQIVIFLFQKYIKSNDPRNIPVMNFELTHLANIDELIITSNDIKKKNYNIEVIYNSFATLLKVAGYKKEQIEQIILEDKLTKTDISIKKMKI